MAKLVRYNGGTEGYYDTTIPTRLVLGKVYKVIGSRDRGFQTDFLLEGIPGWFNAVWFDTVRDDKIYMAVSNSFPVIGDRYHCYKVEFDNGMLELTCMETSTVQEVAHLGNNIFKVTTCHSIYIVNVNM